MEMNVADVRAGVEVDCAVSASPALCCPGCWTDALCFAG